MNKSSTGQIAHSQTYLLWELQQEMRSGSLHQLSWAGILKPKVVANIINTDICNNDRVCFVFSIYKPLPVLNIN